MILCQGGGGGGNSLRQGTGLMSLEVMTEVRHNEGISCMRLVAELKAMLDIQFRSFRQLRLVRKSVTP